MQADGILVGSASAMEADVKYIETDSHSFTLSMNNFTPRVVIYVETNWLGSWFMLVINNQVVAAK